MLKQFREEHSALRKAVGFIHAYQHAEDLEFVKVGDGEKQGYFKLKGIVAERHMKNLIVSMAGNFMAHRMVPGTSWGAGIGYLEVGTGVGTGTTQSPQVEDINQQALRVPLQRNAITSWTFLDSSGNATASETNVVQYTTTFGSSDAVGAIVEMGLFGGDATATMGSGHMFNYKTFPVWNKQSGMNLTVIWNVTF